ncbi:MAG: methyltransferase [Williamsia sp.]|nr:methyltransferase [Williamsia sp.]
MKVSTDSCLFGAWVAEKMQQLKPDCRRILDIGTGTGLLSLMLAQKTAAQINAVEIDPAAAQQATENGLASPWKQRIHVQQTDIKEYAPQHLYDLIISNPPFYEKSLLSPDAATNQARHSSDLTLEQLIQAASNLLAEEGHFAVLLPYNRMDDFLETAANKGFSPMNSLLVSHSTQHAFSRTCVLLNRIAGSEKQPEELYIKEGNQYTGRFCGLLKDYYLYL